MNLGRIDLELRKLFPQSSLEDWKNIAAQETGDKNPLEKLSWRGKDELLFLPYYDAATGTRPIYAKAVHAGKNDVGRQWLNLPLVKLRNTKHANAQALEHLMQGADGVVCDARNVAHPDLNTLTNKVEWEHCYLAFLAGDDSRFPASLTSLLRDKYVPSNVRGALFRESIPEKEDLRFYFETCPHFSALGLLISSSSAADEIARALESGVHAMEAFSDDANSKRVFRSICFSLSADAALLQTIAKFKALRMLWFQIANAYGISDFTPDDLFVHARSAFVANDQFGPHENMIKGTFATMAALMGGCDAVTVEADETISFAHRSARNVSSMLREESFFDRSADPLAGAWAIDALTRAIAAQAWTLFQQKWKTHATT